MGSESARFWAQVEKTAQCWIWLGFRRRGYGAFWLHEEGRWIGAHRWAYTEANGTVPEGLHLDHLCRTPECVRPDHLEAVTPQENYLRGTSVAAINSRKTQCPQGHPFDDSNTYLDKTGRRHCRQCTRDASREWMRRAFGRTHLAGLPPVRNSDKTHCKHGHEYSPENTRTYNGKRHCKTCATEAERRYRERRRQGFS